MAGASPVKGGGGSGGSGGGSSVQKKPAPKKKPENKSAKPTDSKSTEKNNKSSSSAPKGQSAQAQATQNNSAQSGATGTAKEKPASPAQNGQSRPVGQATNNLQGQNGVGQDKLNGNAPSASSTSSPRATDALLQNPASPNADNGGSNSRPLGNGTPKVYGQVANDGFEPLQVGTTDGASSSLSSPFGVGESGAVQSAPSEGPQRQSRNSNRFSYVDSLGYSSRSRTSVPTNGPGATSTDVPATSTEPPSAVTSTGGPMTELQKFDAQGLPEGVDIAAAQKVFVNEGKNLGIADPNEYSNSVVSQAVEQLKSGEMSVEAFNATVAAQTQWNNWTPDKGDAVYQKQLEYYQSQNDPQASQKAMQDAQKARDMLLGGAGVVTPDDIASNYHNLNGLDFEKGRSLLDTQLAQKGIANPEDRQLMVERQLSLLQTSVASGQMAPELFNRTMGGIEDANSWDAATQNRLYSKQLAYYQGKGIPNAQQLAQQDVANARELSYFGGGELDPQKVVDSYGSLNAMDPNAAQTYSQYFEKSGVPADMVSTVIQDERLKILQGTSTVEEFNKNVAGMNDYLSFTDAQQKQLYNSQLQFYQSKKLANAAEMAQLDVESAEEMMLLGGGALPPDKLLANFNKVNAVDLTSLQDAFSKDPNVPEQFRDAYVQQRLAQAKYNVLTDEWKPEDIAFAVKGQQAANAFDKTAQAAVVDVLQKQGLSADEAAAKLADAHGLIANGGGEFTGETVKQLATAGYFTTEGAQLGLGPNGAALGYTDQGGMWKQLSESPPIPGTPVFTMGANGNQQMLGKYNGESKFEGSAAYLQISGGAAAGQKIYLNDLASKLPDPTKNPYAYQQEVAKLADKYGPYTDVQVYDRVGGLIETVKANQLGDKFLHIDIGQRAADGTYAIGTYNDWYTRQMTGQNDKDTWGGQISAGLSWTGGKIMEALSPVGEAIGSHMHGFDQWFDPQAQAFIKGVDAASGYAFSGAAKGYDGWVKGLKASNDPFMKGFGSAIEFVEGLAPKWAVDLAHNREHKFGWLDVADTGITALMAVGGGIAAKFALKNLWGNTKIINEAMRQYGFNNHMLRTAASQVFGKGGSFDPTGPMWARPLGKYLWNSEWGAVRRASKTLPLSYAAGAGIMGLFQVAENAAMGTPWDLHDSIMTFGVGGPISTFWSGASRNTIVAFMEKVPAAMSDNVKKAFATNPNMMAEMLADPRYKQFFAKVPDPKDPTRKIDQFVGVELSKRDHLAKELGLQTVVSNFLMKEGDLNKRDEYHTTNALLAGQHVAWGRLLGAIPGGNSLAPMHSFTALQSLWQQSLFKAGNKLNSFFPGNQLSKQLMFAGTFSTPKPTIKPGVTPAQYQAEVTKYQDEFLGYARNKKFHTFADYVFFANLGIIGQSKGLSHAGVTPPVTHKSAPVPIPLVH
jgi:hypothetical protein